MADSQNIEQQKKLQALKDYVFTLLGKGLSHQDIVDELVKRGVPHGFATDLVTKLSRARSGGAIAAMPPSTEAKQNLSLDNTKKIMAFCAT